MTIRLVFFDIDGTLLSSDGVYSKDLQTQIQRLQKKGIKTAIASGRPSYGARFLIDELSLADAGVFCTGAEVYSPRENVHLCTHELDHQHAYQLYKTVEYLGLYCEHYLHNAYVIEQWNDITDIHSQHLRVAPTIMPIDAIYQDSHPIIKLLLGRDTRTETTPLDVIAQEYPQFDFAFARFLALPDWEFASVVSPQACKQKAFDFLLDYHQLTADQVMAIGDSHSDMTFIQNAGIGVAMGNATNDVKTVADFITKTANEDGVSYALEQFVV